ncbi:DgyrCDS9677 [Dimorphilus gyrociliatus]|uniref:DgyrCDS9677 n=1 Tax=Dimorphilus gyrociliatus TaxID=2664684 RepID=A0A7I8VYZ3_9ANNE|nr:DgyrCDS9677 [Dimorphilus gyrociliatus]
MRGAGEQEESFLKPEGYGYNHGKKGRRVGKFKANAAKLLGAFQFILATVLLIIISTLIGVLSDRNSKKGSYLNNIELEVMCSFAYVYWCVLFFAISGIFGIVSGYKKDKCLIISFMVLSIFSSFFCLPLLFLSGMSLFKFQFSKGYLEAYDWTNDQLSLKLSVITSIVIVVCSILEGVLGVISSAVCCAKVCCMREEQPNSQPVKFIEMKNFQDDGVYHSIRSRNELQSDPMNTTQLPPDYLNSFYTQYENHDLQNI